MKQVDRRTICRLLATLPFASFPLTTMSKEKNGKQNNEALRQEFLSETPDSPGSVILGRPEKNSITMSVLWQSEVQAMVCYGDGEELDQYSDSIMLQAGEPQELVLDHLHTDTAYSYKIIESKTKESLLPVDGFGRFHTQRAQGKAFTFTVQADSHLDGDCLLPLYETTLLNALNANPDFHVDLGDTFMTGKIPNRSDAFKQYKAQRHWLGQIGQFAPIFLVLGNHDGEETNKRGSTDMDGDAVWSCLQRKHYFPNPEPNKFYSGNIYPQQHAGLLQNYYAWQWGDGLFVVLDPYWYSGSTRGVSEPWKATIGKTQYDWLAQTLRSSTAKYKFIFIHQLTGGLDKSGRGGAEAAAYYEWGGHEKDGRVAFSIRRPGWDKPIHDLLIETGVHVVFHGHDHFFAYQELDGIIYQLVPQPAHRNFRNHHAPEYGYTKGVFLPNSGHLRINVTPEHVQVDYIRSATADMEKRGIPNGHIDYSYQIVPNS